MQEIYEDKLKEIETNYIEKVVDKCLTYIDKSNDGLSEHSHAIATYLLNTKHIPAEIIRENIYNFQMSAYANFSPK